MIEKCPLCDASGIVLVFDLPEHPVYLCKECLARFVHPFVDNRSVYDASFIAEKLGYLNSAIMNSCAAEALRQYLAVSGKKILDVGCGTGSFLATLKPHNKVLGLELSGAYGHHLEEKGIPHVIGDLGSSLQGLPDSQFDIITLWDVLEHLENPNETLRHIKKKLSPTGVLVIWTNNYDDSISLFAEAVYRITFGVFTGLIKTSFNSGGGHNYNFVAKSLEKLYRKNGFEILTTVITDTPSKKLATSLFMRAALELFYQLNKLSRKGKIICHVLGKSK